MYSLQYPWALLIVFLPLIIIRIKSAKASQIVALKIPNFVEIKSIEQGTSVKTGSIIAKAMLLCIWLLLCLAIAGPQRIDSPIKLPEGGRDIILAIDLSGSMEAEDMKANGRTVNRLAVVKDVANKFVDQREGDRIGLILFGTHAYLQTPLTFDIKTIKHMIDDATIGLAGPKTAIGDAIGLAVKKLINIESDSKVLVLLTDGTNNEGVVEPIPAAKMAKEFDIKIYTIGLGADELKIPGFFGPQIVNPSQDLDEKTLQEISKITNGVFFRAKDSESLEKVYQTINQLEPNDREESVFRPRYDLLHYPLTIAFILSLVLLLRKLTKLKRWI